MLSACHAVVEGVLILAIQPVIGILGLFSHTKELQGNVQPSTTALWASLEATQDQASPSPQQRVPSRLHRNVKPAVPLCIREALCARTNEEELACGSHAGFSHMPAQIAQPAARHHLSRRDHAGAGELQRQLLKADLLLLSRRGAPRLQRDQKSCKLLGNFSAASLAPCRQDERKHEIYLKGGTLEE